MFASPMGLQRLFFDNFSGDGSRHADFGDRQQAGDSPNPDPANKDPPTIKGTGANGVTYQGCWVDHTDDLAGHALPVTVSPSAQTVEGCTAACVSAGYSVAGMSNGNQCLCGNSLSYASLKVVDKACATACPDDPTQLCGGPSRLSVWSTMLPSQRPQTQTVQKASNFSYLGCYVDSGAARTLSGASSASDSMTVEMCAATCANYQYMGLEYTRECFCGNSLTTATAANATDCGLICSGNSSEFCGGSSRLTLYNNTQVAVSVSATAPTSTSSTSSISTTSTISTISTTSTTSTASTASTISSTTASSSSATSTTATSLNYRGCLVDNGAGGRLLTTQAFSSNNNTVEACSAACSSRGLSIAGLEYGQECWCGSKLAYAAASAPDSDCNMPCTGNNGQNCGAGNRLSIYSALATLPVASAPQVANATADGVYTLQGCWTDSVASRVLPNSMPGGSVDACAVSCADSAVFGVEYGSECYCGSALANASQQVATSECNMLCSSNDGQYCGAGNRLLVYSRANTASASSTTSTAASIASSSSISTTSTPSSTSISTASATVTASTLESTSTASMSSTNTMTSTSSTTTTSSASSTMATTTTSATTASLQPLSTATSLPSGFSNRGCYVDSGDRTLSSISYSNSTNSPQQCASFCRSKGFRFAGTEYSSECFCGDTLQGAGASAGSGQSGCTMPCSGDASQNCGGPNRLNVYEDETWTPHFFTVQQYKQWNFTDCVVDDVSTRVLPTGLTVSGGNSAMTVQNCLDACRNGNYTLCGMEYSGECYAGNAAPAKGFTAAPSPRSGSSDPIARGCSMPCSGDSKLACGGSSRLNLYTLTPSLSETQGTVLQQVS
ncbi:unnamed protein product [Jaminaea pallidilutea]